MHTSTTKPSRGAPMPSHERHPARIVPDPRRLFFYSTHSSYVRLVFSNDDGSFRFVRMHLAGAVKPEVSCPTGVGPSTPVCATRCETQDGCAVFDAYANHPLARRYSGLSGRVHNNPGTPPLSTSCSDAAAPHPATDMQLSARRRRAWRCSRTGCG
jgi:hypothetical protein